MTNLNKFLIKSLNLLNLLTNFLYKNLIKIVKLNLYNTDYSNLKPIFFSFTKNFITLENLRQDRLNAEFHKNNLWKILNINQDQFTFLDLGFMPEFEYRIKQYFSVNSNFYGIDASPKTLEYKKQSNEIVLNKLITSDYIKDYPNDIQYSAAQNCNIKNDSLDPSSERFLKFVDNKKIKKDKNDEINLNDYFNNINLDFVKTDLDGMDMAALYNLKNKLKSKEILGLSVEVLNTYENYQKDNIPKINSVSTVFEYLNNYGYRLIDVSNVRMLRKSARKFKYKKIYNNSDWINSEKGQLTFADYIFFLDPVEIKNILSKEKKIKLISLLDAYDFADVALELINSDENLILETELKEKTNEILIQRIENDYKNFNPLNLKELYLKGSTNKFK